MGADGDKNHGPASPTAGLNTTLKSANVWQVTVPVAINSNKGRFIPTKLTGDRRRRISVEVHRVLPAFDAGVDEDKKPLVNDSLDGIEACYIRVLHPPGSMESIVDPITRKLKDDVKKVEKGFLSVFSKKSKKKSSGSDAEGTGEDADSDEESTDSVMESFLDRSAHENEISTSKSKGEQPFEGWYPKYKIPLTRFNAAERAKNTVVTTYELKGRVTTREIIFETETNAMEFCATIEKNKKLQVDREKGRLGQALGSIALTEGEKLDLLIDICSGTDIPRCDFRKASDPYVVVRFNGMKIHKTDFISSSDDPIWTLRKKSLFVWSVDAVELFKSDEGLTFEVKDYDAIGVNQSLGGFNVSPKTLYKWNGERREFALKPLLGEKDFGMGKIALRVRRATKYDQEFMKKFAESNSKKKDATTSNFPRMKGGKGTLKSITTVYSKKEKEGPDKGKKKYLVRPYPDPARKDETSWLTSEKIEEESLKDSHNWIDAGSGGLGKIFVEIIGCDDLPNLDRGGFGNKTDTFVSLVYEDCFARTDVIDDCLSPRWMPWSQRAFIFNMMHTSSQLFLGVFDNDANPLDFHDAIGRVSVDVSNFRPNTVYQLHYNIYKTANRSPRVPELGSINIRLRMELADEATLLLSNLQLPPSVYVNVEAKKDFHVIRATVNGSVNMGRYSLATISSYVEELMSYMNVYYYIEDSIVNVLLWKGHFKINVPVPDLDSFAIKKVPIALPLHSMAAFFFFARLVEDPDLLPSFFFGSICWLLLATSGYRSSSPNPWLRCKSFQHFMSALTVGNCVMGVEKIAVNENLEESAAVLQAWTKRIKDAEDQARQRALDYAKEQEEYYKELEEIGETDQDISTKDGGFTIDPTKQYLYPIQQYLQIICEITRVIKNIVVWEESYLSFLLTVSSFALSIILYFVPWGFFVKWTLRLIVWTLFGPWMKLVDIFYVSKIKPETEEEKKEREGRTKLERLKRLEGQILDAQVAREKAAKLKDFKQYMFGQFVSRVNIIKFDRFYDVPLPKSSASEYIPKPKTLGELAMQEAGYHRTRIEGQNLVGDMIPKIAQAPSTEAPVGKPAKKTDLLEENSPGAIYAGDDSYGPAIAKISAIVFSAGAITWFGVPLLVYLVRLAIPGPSATA